MGPLIIILIAVVGRAASEKEPSQDACDASCWSEESHGGDCKAAWYNLNDNDCVQQNCVYAHPPSESPWVYLINSQASAATACASGLAPPLPTASSPPLYPNATSCWDECQLGYDCCHNCGSALYNTDTHDCDNSDCAWGFAQSAVPSPWVYSETPNYPTPCSAAWASALPWSRTQSASPTSTVSGTIEFVGGTTASSTSVPVITGTGTIQSTTAKPSGSGASILSGLHPAALALALALLLHI
jgi:hypothetical protein